MSFKIGLNTCANTKGPPFLSLSLSFLHTLPLSLSCITHSKIIQLILSQATTQCIQQIQPCTFILSRTRTVVFIPLPSLCFIHSLSTSFKRSHAFCPTITHTHTLTRSHSNHLCMQSQTHTHTHIHTLTHTHTRSGTHMHIHILLACSHPNFLLRPVEREGRILVTAVAQYQSLQFGLTTKKSVTLNRSMKFDLCHYAYITSRAQLCIHYSFSHPLFCICYVKKCNGHFFQTIRSFFSFRDPFCFLRSLF